MPKQLAVDPTLLRRAGRLTLNDIPVHAYATPFAHERAVRGDAALLDVLRHMLLIRGFESMLAAFKAQGHYGGINYNYKGPAHLSIGQEAAAVGSALSLTPADHIFGSHRSHGEFIAKGLAAIQKLPPAEVMRIMEAEQSGRLLRVVETLKGGNHPTALAENFLLFGLVSEIFMRSTGFNGGMGGSMHAFFPPFGAYPNNAIVGASAGIATGAALRKKLTRADSITVAHAGDGATGCGPVWEAMNFASMGQFNTLWPDDLRGGLPVLFFFTNNFYAMGGQTSGETMGWDRLARIGAGINPSGLHAETVDGCNPLAVADAVARQRARLLAGDGPALLDVECYRFSGHSTTDANAYRSREEIKAWEANDPIALYSAQLLAAGILTSETAASLQADIDSTLLAITRVCVDPTTAPSLPVAATPTVIGTMMFADRSSPLPSSQTPMVMIPEDTTRVRQDAKKARFGLSETGETLSPLRAITLRDGLFEALLHHMRHDPRLIAYGEECREWGGAFGVYRGLADIFPHDRLFNAPISEAAIVATAVGYGLAGGRAVVELMYADFIGRAGDEIFNQMAKWHAMSAGQLRVPVVLRTSVGSKYGAQHSQDWTGLVAHIPGLKVVYPASPYDAKGLLAEALAGDDPVVFFESQRLYDTTERFQPGGVPRAYYRLPLGQSDVKRAGLDVTIVTIGPSLYPALAAADALRDQHGVSAEVIDARCLVPFDYATVMASLHKTGHLLIVSEACERGSFAMTVASTLTHLAFSALRAAPRVLGAPNWIVPGADMEATYFPHSDDIVTAVLALRDPSRDKTGREAWDVMAMAQQGL